MAEQEIGIMDKQCTGTRIRDKEHLITEVTAWEQRRNYKKCKIKWGFTREIADQKLGRHYVA
jgi:hypothetical protein